MSKQAHHTKH